MVIATFSFNGWSAITTLSFSYSVKPSAATVRMYLPGCKVLNSYMPWALLWTTIGDPAAGVMITLALGMTAPEGSVICPRRAPEGVCAANPLTNSENKSTTKKKREHFSTLIIIFLIYCERINRRTILVESLKELWTTLTAGSAT